MTTRDEMISMLNFADTMAGKVPIDFFEYMIMAKIEAGNTPDANVFGKELGKILGKKYGKLKTVAFTMACGKKAFDKANA